MLKSILKLTLAIAVVFTSAFVYRSATENSVTLSATELGYIPAGEPVEYSYLTLDELKASWQDLKASFQETSFYQYFADFDISDFWGDWNSQDFYDQFRIYIDGLNYNNESN